MRLTGVPATAPRMLLLDHVRFEPGCAVYVFDRPLFLLPGDRIWAEQDSVAVRRFGSGRVEWPAGGAATGRWG
ncbi:hypothetical protein [Kitasatospora sp. MMS16-BH015]|uniref:hypothetical protein n=1 Tax=Kitasatospora sp. MMS16-BH015 TaxID=2018025 RepID=UPI00131A4D18|nr:hypothetical protein [Kitasatospora sp. MMS16-BH015]